MPSGTFNINSIIDIRQYDYINSSDKSSMLKDTTVYKAGSNKVSSDPINRFMFVKSQTDDQYFPEDYITNPGSAYNIFAKIWTNRWRQTPFVFGSWIVEAYKEGNETKYRMPSENSELSNFKYAYTNTSEEFYDSPVFGVMPWNARGFLYNGKFGEKDILVRRLNHRDIIDWDEALADWSGEGGSGGSNVFNNGITVSGLPGSFYAGLNVNGPSDFNGNVFIDKDNLILKEFIPGPGQGEYEYISFEDYINGKITDNIIYTDACTNCYISYSNIAGNNYKIYYPVLSDDLINFINLENPDWEKTVSIKIYKNNEFVKNESDLQKKIIVVKQPSDPSSNILNNHIEFILTDFSDISRDFNLNGDSILDKQDIYGWGKAVSSTGGWENPNWEDVFSDKPNPENKYNEFPGGGLNFNGWSGFKGLQNGINYYYDNENSKWIDISPSESQSPDIRNNISFYKYIIKNWRDVSPNINSFATVEELVEHLDTVSLNRIEYNDWVEQGWKDLISKYGLVKVFTDYNTEGVQDPLLNWDTFNNGTFADPQTLVKNAIAAMTNLDPVNIWESLGSPIAPSILNSGDNSYIIDSSTSSGEDVLTKKLVVDLGPDESLGSVFTGQEYPVGTPIETILFDLLQKRYCEEEYVLPDFKCISTKYTTSQNEIVTSNFEVLGNPVTFTCKYEYDANDGPLKSGSVQFSINNSTINTSWRGRDWTNSWDILVNTETRKVEELEITGTYPKTLGNNEGVTVLQVPSVYYNYNEGSLDNSARLKIDSKGCYNGYPKNGERVSSIWADNKDKIGYGQVPVDGPSTSIEEKTTDASGNLIISCFGPTGADPMGDQIYDDMPASVIPTKINLKYPVFYYIGYNAPTITDNETIFDDRNSSISPAGYNFQPSDAQGDTWQVKQYSTTCMKNIALGAGTKYIWLVTPKTISSVSITSQGFTSVFRGYTELTNSSEKLYVHYIDNLDKEIQGYHTYKFEWPDTDLVGSDTTITVNFNS